MLDSDLADLNDLRRLNGSWGLTLEQRIQIVWKKDEEQIYFQLLKQVFPSIERYPDLVLDPEFGPLIFRRWHVGIHSLVLVLRQKMHLGVLWYQVIDNATLYSHGKESDPRWLHGICFRRMNRVARNELFLECGLV
jgi:hypothetical protein